MAVVRKAECCGHCTHHAALPGTTWIGEGPAWCKKGHGETIKHLQPEDRHYDDWKGLTEVWCVEVCDEFEREPDFKPKEQPDG